MPRRNKRQDEIPPLDLTPAEIPPPPKPKPVRPGERGEDWIAKRKREERERAERQRLARIKGGIDWTICLVPGCGEELRSYGMLTFRHAQFRDPEKTLPLCIDHALIVWQDVQRSKHEPIVMESNDALIERTREREAAKQEEAKRRHLARQDGHLYYLRLNGLIKVGWTRDLRDRLRAYGPDVEVLCHYKGTRPDETTLHRNLRPFLARGREWYEDSPAMRDIVAREVERHGAPYITATWTVPAEAPVRARKGSRSKPTGLSI